MIRSKSILLPQISQLKAFTPAVTAISVIKPKHFMSTEVQKTPPRFVPASGYVNPNEKMLDLSLLKEGKPAEFAFAVRIQL
jgi:hypothetical protein